MTGGHPNAARGLWSIRQFQPDDLEAAVHLWELWSTADQAPQLTLGDLVQALSDGVPAVVTEIDGELIGAAFARVSGQRGWIQRLVLAEPWRRRGIGRAMLSELESQLHDAGIDRLVAVIPPASGALFAACGWQVTRDVAFAEKSAVRLGAQERLLRLLDARRFDATLWEATVAGTPAAQVIQRRVVEPIRHPEIAGALDVRVPAALLLFGPPGTGKTTFAHALSGRLGWPLVEWIRPVAGGTSPAQDLAAFFEATSQLANVVLFLDEVEEFAATRSEQSPASAAACTNELLKALTRFRTAGDKVLVASTNHIDRLDPAVLRPGRFDLVLPVGPPDDAARGRQIDARMKNVANDVSNFDDLVDGTRGYTSADLAHVLDAAIQLAFDDALSGGQGRVNRDHLSTAASRTSPSLTDPSLAVFADQAARYGRQ